MCTALFESHIRPLFGRTLDLECSFGESVVVTPRGFFLPFRHEPPRASSLAIIGIAREEQGFPLYYDAVNEAGLAIAALNFPTNAVYGAPRPTCHNVASFELIPWLLSQCKTLSEAIQRLKSTVIVSDSFSDAFGATPLHWMLADASGAVTVETTEQGLRLYDNPFGVLTNNPPFPYHTAHLTEFLALDSAFPANRICSDIALSPYSRGMGAMGLPGDYSSASRFVRAVFAKSHTDHGATPQEEISRFFHVMDTVSVPLGCVRTDGGKSVSTVYTSCADLSTAAYYVTTYRSRRIRAFPLSPKALSSQTLLSFPIDGAEDIAK